MAELFLNFPPGLIMVLLAMPAALVPHHPRQIFLLSVIAVSAFSLTAGPGIHWETEISRFNRTCGSLHRLKNPPRPSSENSIEIACGNSETDQDAQIGHSPPKQISRACELEESSGSSKPVGSNTKFIPHGFLGSSNPEFKDLMKDYLLGKVRWVAGKDARTFATIKERNGRDTNLICLFP